MEVGTAIPQLAWNGLGKHNSNDSDLITAGDSVKHSALISTEYDDMTALDNSDSRIPPPLPTTPPPDYFNGTESMPTSSSLQESHTMSGEFCVSLQGRACHSVTKSSASETIKQAKALSDGDSSSDDGDDLDNDERLDVLEQLKSSSTSKLMQLQQLQLTEGNTTQQPRTVHLSSEDNAQVEIMRLRKVKSYNYLTILY